ncbi:hypothetical protein, partial [Anaerotignum sp.]
YIRKSRCLRIASLLIRLAYPMFLLSCKPVCRKAGTQDRAFIEKILKIYIGNSIIIFIIFFRQRNKIFKVRGGDEYGSNRRTTVSGIDRQD